MRPGRAGPAARERAGRSGPVEVSWFGAWPGRAMRDGRELGGGCGASLDACKVVTHVIWKSTRVCPAYFLGGRWLAGRALHAF